MQSFRILLIPGYQLFPVDSGGAHHQLVFLAKQQLQHQIDLVVTPRNIAEADIPAFEKQFPSLRLIRVGYERPGPGKRIARFFRKLVRKHILKTFPYRVKKNRHLRNLLLRDLEFIDAVREIAASGHYALIQVEHTINLSLVEVLPWEVPRIFVHHEISHTRIGADLLACGETPGFASRVASMAEELELNWLRNYDGIITLSGEDRGLLQQKGISSPIAVAEPFAYFEGEVEKHFDPVPTPDLLFVGGESHYPNREGLDWFLRKIFPALSREFPATRLHVTGRWSDEFVAEHQTVGVEFTGFVEDLRPLMKDHIMIIPVRIGSGVRVKALLAFGNGVPVVSTPAGIAGIPGLEDRKHVMLGHDAHSFAAALREALRSQDLRRNISDACFELARSRSAGGQFVRERNEFYDRVFNAFTERGAR